MAASMQTPSPSLRADGLRTVVSELGTTSSIVLEGEWDLLGQQAVRQTVNGVLARRPEHLVLDLSRLSFTDSSGVHGAVEVARHSERVGVSLVIVPGPRAVQCVFELTEAEAILPFVRD